MVTITFPVKSLYHIIFPLSSRTQILNFTFFTNGEKCEKNQFFYEKTS